MFIFWVSQKFRSDLFHKLFRTNFLVNLIYTYVHYMYIYCAGIMYIYIYKDS